MGEKKEREREEKVRTEEKKERRGVRAAVFSWAISKDQIKLEGKLRSNPKGNCTFMKSSQ